MSSASSRTAARNRSRASRRSPKERPLQAGKAASAAAIADAACSASSRLVSAKVRPVAGLTAPRRPARPSTSRLPIQEWSVAAAGNAPAAVSVAMGDIVNPLRGRPPASATMER